MTWIIRLVQTNLLPDSLVRLGVRAGLWHGARQRDRFGLEQQNAQQRALIARFRQSPIAIDPAAANRQHYEVPTELFELVLGKWLKYSCCYWPQGVTELDQAEEAMLRLTCERARLQDGMEVLDLGCGWGSLTLWIAEHYPYCHVLAISNSRSQVEFIQRQCAIRGLHTVEALVADVNELVLDRTFDRVLSIEMFEHMKNYERLMARIAALLEPNGLLFVHLFSHRTCTSEFDANDPNDWMAQTFFGGGTMPSDDLLLHFQRDLCLVDHWRLSGLHYARTLRAWLEKLDRQRDAVQRALDQAYGAERQGLWLANWRLFFLACEETWRFRGGNEYLISHYLFDKRS
jgi:cyclopropane-fatty-acyl-phospholipid synthase